MIEKSPAKERITLNPTENDFLPPINGKSDRDPPTNNWWTSSICRCNANRRIGTSRDLTSIGLHELFDTIAEEIEAEVDEVAERAVALGGLVDGTVEGVSKKTTLDAYPTNITNGKDHVELLSSALAAAGKRVRAAIDQTDELGDADTADLLTGVVPAGQETLVRRSPFAGR